MKSATFGILAILPFVSLAQSGDNVLSFPTVASLRAYNTSAFGATVPQALTAGYNGAGDDGGNRFYWSAISTAADNGGTVIKPTTSTIGRWLAVNSTPLNVKAFGAFGDGTTNDTTNLNKAIAVANASDKTLLFPPGTYVITPGSLNEITCSVSGPDAILLAANGTSAPLITINYKEADGYPFRTFRVRQISGIPLTYNGTGLYIKFADYARIEIRDLRWFHYGVHLDGAGNDAHIANNIIDIGNLFVCYDGMVLSAGTGSNWCETNIIRIGYSQGHTHSAMTLSGGSLIHDNTIFFTSMEMNQNQPAAANSNGIICGAAAQTNEFIGRGGFGGSTGGRDIITSGTGNRFRISQLNRNRITSSGGDFFLNAATTATSLALQNAWVNFGAGRVNGVYRINEAGRVDLDGFVKSGGYTDNTLIAHIPDQFAWPDATRVFPAVANNLPCLIQVDIAGDIRVFGATGNSSLSLSGISYPAALTFP